MPIRVSYDAVYIDCFEGHLLGEVKRHHDHPCYPEKDNVMASYQSAGGQEML